MALPLKWMPAYSHGGPFVAGQPTVIVVHSTESDNAPALAEAIAGPGWFGGSKAGTSAHKVVDVDSICEGVKRTTVAYHAGPGGNVRGIAYEFCGRASWSAAKWREPAQLQMLRNAAPHIADDLIAITGSRQSAMAACRWLSLAQLGARQRGLCTHNDIRLVFGGTTHTDPGPNFPYAELLAYVLAELAGTPIAEDDMPLTDEDIRRIYDYGVKRVDGRWITLRDFLAWDDAKIDAVKKLIDGRDPVGVDAASLVEGLKPLLLEAVREGMAADNDAEADAIVDRLAERLAGARDGDPATGPVS